MDVLSPSSRTVVITGVVMAIASPAVFSPKRNEASELNAFPPCVCRRLSAQYGTNERQTDSETEIEIL
eukprot:15506-Rhodomonas_salina.1